MPGFWVMQVVFAVYLAVLAVRGKHRIFYYPHIKKGMEEKYKKTCRAGIFCVSVLLLLLAGANWYMSRFAEAGGLHPVVSAANFVLVGLTLTVLLLFALLLHRMQDRAGKTQARRSAAPRAAFYFDETQDKEPGAAGGSAGDSVSAAETKALAGGAATKKNRKTKKK